MCKFIVCLRVHIGRPRGMLIVLVCLFFIVFPQFAVFGEYYLDSGGSSISLIVVRPAGESLSSEDEFVLDYIQTLLLGNFKKYTAIKTSGQDANPDVKKTETAFLLIGKLTRTGNSYVLEMTVTDPSSGVRKASYYKTNITASEILNAQAINAAFLDIVKKLDVNLSDAGIAAVNNPTREEVQAAINLARGNAAEKRGNPIEMMTYLYNAVSYDPELLEAGTRFENFSRMLSAGDVGSSIKSDLEDREKWKVILDEFDTFYYAHPPFMLSYDPDPTQKGYSDYDNRTAVLEFEMVFQEDVAFTAMRKVYAAVISGLKTTKSQERWDFATRPFRSPLFRKFRYYEVKAELVNNRDQAVAVAVFRVRSRIFPLRNTLLADTSRKFKQSFNPIHIDDDLTGDMIVRIVSIDGIETEKAMQDGYVKIIPAEKLPKAKTVNLLAILTRDLFLR